MGVHVCPILNPPPTSPSHHPSGSSQCTSPKHLAPCIEPRLAICSLYDSIHVSMPFSQIIPPSPSPTESKRLFYRYLFELKFCWRYAQTVLSTVVASICILTNSIRGLPFLHTLSTVCYSYPIALRSWHPVPSLHGK